MKQLFLTICIFSWLHSFSQNCDEAALAKLPGTWKAGMKNPNNHVSAATVQKAGKITVPIHNSFKQKYTPKGLQALYSIPAVSLEPDEQLYTYGYGIYFLKFECFKNEIKPAIATPTVLIVKINPGFFFFADGQVNYDLRDSDTQYGSLQHMPVQKDGIWDLGDKKDLTWNKGEPEHECNWLVTFDGQLPFTYVTQLEYLQKYKAKMLTHKEKALEDTKQRFKIRTKAEQEKERDAVVKKIKEKAAQKKDIDWSDRYLKTWQTDEQIQEGALKKTIKMYDDKLEKANDYLKKPEKDLQQTAIVNSSSAEFKGFLKEGDRGAIIIIKENPAYYNRKLAKEAPQVILVSFEYHDGYPVYVNAFNEVVKMMDFSLLKNLIGKL